MKFEDDLYVAMQEIYPKITVRSFSLALGRSSGYWSSITAQGLPVSNTALIHLSDYLECRKLLLESCDARVHKLAEVQRMVAREIVDRFALENESFEEVWDEVSASLRIEKVKEAELYGAMPFMMLRG